MRKITGTIIAVALAACLLLTACQPTPEVPPVVNKVESERVQRQKIEATQPPTQKPAYTAPNEWREVLLTEQDGKFSIVADADIVFPQSGDIAVYSATTLSALPQERFDKLLEGFFGDTPLLQTEEYSRETLDEWLLEGKKSLAEMENGSFDFTMFDNYDGSEASRQEIISARRDYVSWVEKQIANTPEGTQDVPFDSDVTNVPIFGRAKTDDGSDMRVEAHISDGSLSIRLGDPQLTVNGNLFRDVDIEELPQPGLERTTLEQALAQADEAMARMGFEDYVTQPEEYAISREFFGDLAESQEGNVCAFGFEYRRNLSGMCIRQIPRGDRLQASDDDYINLPAPESILIYVNDNGVTALTWDLGYEITGTLNEAVELLPFDDIKEAIARTLNQIYPPSWKGNADGSDNDYELLSEKDIADIVRLDYGLLPEKDKPDSFLIVPMWNVYVGFEIHDRYRDPETGEMVDSPAEPMDDAFKYGRMPMVSINALDGSIYAETRPFQKLCKPPKGCRIENIPTEVFKSGKKNNDRRRKSKERSVQGVFEGTPHP